MNPPTNHQTTHGSNGVYDKGQPTFGVDLAEQMTRDNVEVPSIMQKCCEAIEKYGIQSQGIYRVSGTTSKVANLKQKLDRGQSFIFNSVSSRHLILFAIIDLEAVDLDAHEWSGDINNVASVMKMWLRELPEPLMTHSLHQGFVEGASE